MALAVLAFLITDAQDRRQQLHEDQRAAQQRAAAADLERESTWRTYLAQISYLVPDYCLLRSNAESDVSKIAGTATLAAVRRLDGSRRGFVVQFSRTMASFPWAARP